MEEFLKLGLLNWYPIKNDTEVLILGCDTAYEKDFTRRGLNVSQCCNLKELTEKNQYDYIVIYCADRFLMDIEKSNIDIRNLLKSKGHLLLACNNRLALKNFVGDADPYSNGSFDGIENYCNYTEKDLCGFEGRCYAKNEIEMGIKKMGFLTGQYRGYSIYPGLDMPQLIYAWDYLPNEDMESRYTPLYNDAGRIFVNETKISDSLIQNGMFHAMANAYLMDCSFDDNFYEFNQVTTSMERGEENATATILQKNGKVIKKALYPKGNVAIKTLTENMCELQRRGIATVEFEPQFFGRCDGEDLLGIQMPCIHAPLAIEYLRNLLCEDKEMFKKAVCKFLDIVLCSGDVIQEQHSELGPVYEVAYFDLVPINCFVINEEFVFFDQEYAVKNYPINVVLMRVLDFIYAGNKKSNDIFPMTYFTEKYHLNNKMQIYRNMSSAYLDKLKNSTALLKFRSIHKADSRVVNMNRQKLQYDIQTYLSLFINYLSDIDGKDVYIFGSGLWAQKFVAEYGDRLSIVGMLDNNSSKWGRVVAGATVIDPMILKKLQPESYKVIICVKQYADIVRQLEKLGTCNYGIYDPNIDISEFVKEKNCKSHSESADDIKEEHHIEGKKRKPYHVGFVAGVFDLFHVGHLNLLKRAKEQCDILLVGVVSDEQASKGKRHSPYVPENERMEIVKACKYVDTAFIMPMVSASARDIYKKYHFDVMFSGDDYKDDAFWLGEREWLRAHGADIVFFPYTQSTSSTKLKAAIEKENVR